MHLRTTNKSAKTLDVHRFCFEFTSALEFDNEQSGPASARSGVSMSIGHSAEPGHRPGSAPLVHIERFTGPLNPEIIKLSNR